MEKLHIAIIMDGNGRWAQRRGLSRMAGHAAGARAVRRVVEAAVQLEVGTLTLYAFSADNWSRPECEVNALMRLLRQYLHSETEHCRANNIHVSIIGRRDRLPASVGTAIETIERQTAACTGLRLRLAIDYSARHAIAEFADRAADAKTFKQLLDDVAPVDLLLRTGGEKRLSDFLLWECAYAELSFLDLPWPEFGRDELLAALIDFNQRQRRFGRIVALAP